MNMNIAIKTMVPWGVQGKLITIEVDNNRSLPTIDIIGLPDSAVKESRERLRATFRHSNIEIPPHKFIINLSPSDIRKTGAGFDLPIATALLCNIIGNRIRNRDICINGIFIGELGLDGSVKGISGLLPIVVSAKKEGYNHFFVPIENIAEISQIPGISIYPLSSFNDIKSILVDGVIHKTITGGSVDIKNITTISKVLFEDIEGHEHIKHILAINAAGLHNILMIGPPGTGKSMLAKALQSILPPMNFDEIISVSQIYSLSGKLHNQQPLIIQRPFRAIHHTASKISLIGGGQKLLPGEISHAHNGILFLDELPEFPRDTLDVLRQPIEDKEIMISRAHGSVIFPADCMVVGAMNPCICGYYNDTEKVCTCSVNSIKKYQSRISGPLLDRFDSIIEVTRQEVGQTYTRITSQEIAQKVAQAWHIQQKRFEGTPIRSNANIPPREIVKYIILDKECENIVQLAQKKLQLSHRAIHKILKLTRSIADYDGSDIIKKQHLLEALQYRSKNMFI